MIGGSDTEKISMWKDDSRVWISAIACWVIGVCSMLVASLCEQRVLCRVHRCLACLVQCTLDIRESTCWTRDTNVGTRSYEHMIMIMVVSLMVRLCWHIFFELQRLIPVQKMVQSSTGLRFRSPYCSFTFSTIVDHDRPWSTMVDHGRPCAIIAAPVRT